MLVRFTYVVFFLPFLGLANPLQHPAGARIIHSAISYLSYVFICLCPFLTSKMGPKIASRPVQEGPKSNNKVLHLSSWIFLFGKKHSECPGAATDPWLGHTEMLLPRCKGCVGAVALKFLNVTAPNQYHPRRGERSARTCSGPPLLA